MNKRTYFLQVLALCWALLVFPLQASDQVPAPPQDHPIALTGGTIYTVSGDIIENGTILFESGKITAIGTTVDLPEGTEVIDISGKRVYPSLIDANTVLGLVEVASVRATRDYSETGEITPEVHAGTAFNPDSELLPVTRANGIALAMSVPAGGLISGTSALMMLDGWTWEEMALKTPAGLHVRWPSMVPPKKPSKQTPKYIKSIEKIKSTFAKARAYASAAKNAANDDNHESSTRWEAMIPVVEGKIPVFVHANSIRQIQAAVSWAADENLKMILVGGYDAWRVSDLLKTYDIPVIVTGTHKLPRRRWEAYNTPFSLPKKLHDAGVKFCIGGSGFAFSTAHTRNLPYHAATAAAYGLPTMEALKSVTLYPAEIIGAADRVGSLENGKDATLIVTNGDPLEIMTQIESVYIQGRKIDVSSRHTELYEKYQEKYRQKDILKQEGE